MPLMQLIPAIKGIFVWKMEENPEQNQQEEQMIDALARIMLLVAKQIVIPETTKNENESQQMG